MGPRDKDGRRSWADDITRVTVRVDRERDRPPPAAIEGLDTAEPLPAGISPRLVRIVGERAVEETIMREPVLMIGRASGVAEVVVEDELVSRYHACVFHRAGRFYVADMGSRNGTALNGRLVGEAQVHSGDRIQVGGTLFEFRLDR